MERWILAALIGALALGGPTRALAQGAPAAMAHDHHDMAGLPATDGPGFVADDVRFMQGMIAHHAQAIRMARWAPMNGAGPRLLALAQKIDISQTDEIEMMERWLAERNQAVPTPQQIEMMTMPGMLSPEQMAQLEAARGVEFERLFLAFMIQHHEGALVMAETLLASPKGAQDSDIFRFLTDVVADQSAEIDVMRSMLDALPGVD